MTSATERRRPDGPGGAAAFGLLAALLAPGAPVTAADPSASPTPAPARTPAPAPTGAPSTKSRAATPPAAHRLTPGELRSSLDKADKYLGQSERLVRGDDPGRVSLTLARADEELTRFQEGSALLPLQRAFEDARHAARVSDMGAADSMDGQQLVAALDRFEEAVLAPVLLARLRESREAISRARQAMVHRNMPEGRNQVAAARRALDGLEYAGALSRASFSLSIGAELLGSDSVIAGRDQVQKAARELRRAVDAAPDKDTRTAVEEARVTATEVWKRSGRASRTAAAQLVDLAARVEALRRQQRV